jgi:D-lyxose ketol-isomerase
MKRSEINARLVEAKQFLAGHNFHLPPWATWGPEEWKAAGPEADEIRTCRLGWDLTDFGKGDYDDLGLLLFTIRNGRPDKAGDRQAKDYCEKMLLVGDGQMTPTHFHWSKMEDIINRSGGVLVLQCWLADRQSEQRDDHTPVTVSIDGIERTFQPGQKIRLAPGESITLGPYVYHLFYGEGGAVLAGEVSRVNDDERDNRFLEPLGRFPQIEEDEPPLHLLCNEYPPA